MNPFLLLAPLALAEPVVVTTGPLYAGTVIEEHMVATADVEHLPSDAIRQRDQAVGRRVAEDVDRGEILRESRIANRTEGRGPSALIPVGMRALDVRLAHVAPAVRPGDYVDVYMVSETRSCALVQAVYVLAVPTSDEPFDSNGSPGRPTRHLVLALTPEQVVATADASLKHELHAVLRNVMDIAYIAEAACP